MRDAKENVLEKPKDLIFKEVAERAYQVAKKNGFYDNPDILDLLNEIKGEVDEAIEEWNNKEMSKFKLELADIILRTLSLSRYLRFDIDKFLREKMDYNDTRPYLHGKGL